MSQSSTSPGNAGSRGSEGQANGGAEKRDSTHQRELPFASDEEADLRDADARGGGGAASNSSRSQDRTPGRIEREE
jgi:hypothetical protein